ncbi:MAG TPA: N-acetyltransferase [Candidatus Limnocylindria bacterium]|nr:N-acetyltransferase [Candidatus Limnocylindria bacterium]
MTVADITPIPGLTLRPERPEEYRETEEVTREAFYNRYAPGTTTHYVLHLLRKDPAFEPWHSIVAEYDGAVIGHILLSPAFIRRESGEDVPVLTIGPVTVLPAAALRGVGSALMREAMARAREHGAPAVVLTGNPAYYRRFGFVSASRFGIRYPGVPADREAAFFMAYPLEDGALDGCGGLYEASPLFEADGPEFDAFDATFPPRRKLKLPGQLV